VWRVGWRDGEIKRPEQNGAILIDDCPLAEHLCERFVLDGDVDSTSTIHHELQVDLPQRLLEFDWMEMSPVSVVPVSSIETEMKVVVE
jgi:hypothetical protein